MDGAVSLNVGAINRSICLIGDVNERDDLDCNDSTHTFSIARRKRFFFRTKKTLYKGSYRQDIETTTSQ